MDGMPCVAIPSKASLHVLLTYQHKEVGVGGECRSFHYHCATNVS